ncbi:hypothetical protein ASC95_22285 [Pelomonas sp. Root1217]|nr:hypothetical protein ASC95_22285 [Pelomonas sp. Root1217]
MLCIDDDRPHDFMFHLWGHGADPVGFLATPFADGEGAINVRPQTMFVRAANGSLYPDSAKTGDLDGFTANLRRTKAGFAGSWSHVDGRGGRVLLSEGPHGHELIAESCETWDQFKTWAVRARQSLDAVLFRGHGSNKFRLQTTLHRAGRTRLDRYCAEILPAFHAQVEAVLGLKLDMTDGRDYALVMGLAQHHGLPTPLLDWSESPYIAAFFAFSDALEYASARTDVTHVRVLSLARDFVDVSSPPTVVLEYATPYVACLAIPPRLNPRLQAQQGRFLVTNIADVQRWFGKAQKQVDESFLHAIDIPVECAREALEDLKFMGVTAATMFPGLDGVSRKLRHEMAFSRPPIRSAGLPAEAAAPLQPEHAAGTSGPDEKE